MKTAVVLLCVLSGLVFAAEEPGKGYKLVHKVDPINDGRGKERDIVQEIYEREGEDVAGPRYKLVLASYKRTDVPRELLFSFERMASATISPEGHWIVVDDRSSRGHCEPRLFALVAGLKFQEIKDAKLRTGAIDFFLKANKLYPSLRKTMVGEGDCFVQFYQWANDEGALMLRVSKQRTGEKLWISDWYCVYDLKNKTFTLDLNALNRGAFTEQK